MEPIQLNPWAVVAISRHTGRLSVIQRAAMFGGAVDVAAAAEAVRLDNPWLDRNFHEVDVVHAAELIERDCSPLRWRQPQQAPP